LFLHTPLPSLFLKVTHYCLRRLHRLLVPSSLTSITCFEKHFLCNM
jgi:hypothetical protein